MILQGKRMTCMNVETGTLIFAIINIIAAVVSSLCAIAIFTISMVSMSSGMDGYDKDSVPTNAQFALLMWFLSLFAMFASFIGLVFAVFLIHGVVKKNPAHIKAYFIYGVVVTILCALPVVGFSGVAIDKFGTRDLGVFLGAFLALFIYSLILNMIQRTYKKFENMKIQYDHQPLAAEKC